MRRMPLMIVACCAGLCSAVAAADRPAEQLATETPPEKTFADLHAMQGRWTREFTNRQGAVFRGEKTIDGNRDSVTELDANGNRVYAHICTFELKIDGKVRILTFSNVAVTAGPNLGARIPGPRSFIYKLDGDTMYEIWGLLDGDTGPPLIYAWKRIKDKP